MCAEVLLRFNYKHKPGVFFVFCWNYSCSSATIYPLIHMLLYNVIIAQNSPNSRPQALINTLDLLLPPQRHRK